MTAMSGITIWLQQHLGLSPDIQLKLSGSAAILIALWLLRLVVIRAVYHRTDDVKIRYTWSKSTAYVGGILSVFLVGRIWIAGVGSLATVIGLISAGLAIALRDVVANFAGWVFILVRRPFELGDRIQVGSYAGDVVDIRLFQFSLLEIGNWVDADQATGRLLHVPNGKVLTEVTANYGKGFKYIWNEVPVLVTFETNWEKAKQILTEVAERHGTHLTEEAQRRVREAAKKFMIFYRKLTPIVYTKVAESGVRLTLRYLCEPRTRRQTEQEIWEEILREFAKHDDIDFAYPTQRFFQNWKEGKSDLRPSDGHPDDTGSIDGLA
jgi:small-conductance mechanosensitive channel